jgi:type IV secretion system protein VirB2
MTYAPLILKIDILKVFCFLGLGLVISSPAFAQAQGASPILNAALFVQGILLGPVATAIAVVAVAMVGFMMLTGRMNWRYGATVIVGCFILFGAPRLVSLIQAAG